MKYLSTFKTFESLTPTEQDELKEFCDEYLVHLYDKGFKVKFTTAPRKQNDNELIDVNRMFIMIGPAEALSDDPKKAWSFPWQMVRDYMIPFIDILNDNYELGNFGTSGRKDVTNAAIRLDMVHKQHFYTPEEIITNGHRLRHNLGSICIMVMGKKE